MGNPGRSIFGKASYMKLIDNIILYGNERLLTVAPVKVISHHTGFVQTVRLVNPVDAPFAPVSYTHLDVYKRQIVEMTLPEDNSQIFASKYQTVLPSKEELQRLLDDQI